MKKNDKPNHVSRFYFHNMNAELTKRMADGSLPTPSTDDPIVRPPEALFTFAAFGDPQVSNYMFAREACFYASCRDFKSMPEPLDALIIAGDIAENGMRCEYRMVAQILNEVSDKIRHVVLMPGNHDIRLRGFLAQQFKFRGFVKSVTNGVPPERGKYWFACDFDACRFLVMGSDTASFEGAHISHRQLKWLETELADAEKQNKPVFVMNHQPLKKTNGLPGAWQGVGSWRGSVGNQSKALRGILSSHKNVFFLTGHLHQGVCQASFEDYGSYKCLNLPTVGANNHGSYNELSQGYVISVFRDRVEMRARLFGKGEYVPEEIPNAFISVPLDK